MSRWYIAHAAVKGSTNSNHKYYKRIGTSGSYIYFYTPEEYTAYTNGKSKGVAGAKIVANGNQAGASANYFGNAGSKQKAKAQQAQAEKARQQKAAERQRQLNAFKNAANSAVNNVAAAAKKAPSAVSRNTAKSVTQHYANANRQASQATAAAKKAASAVSRNTAKQTISNAKRAGEQAAYNAGRTIYQNTPQGKKEARRRTFNSYSSRSSGAGAIGGNSKNTSSKKATNSTFARKTAKNAIGANAKLAAVKNARIATSRRAIEANKNRNNRMYASGNSPATAIGGKSIKDTIRAQRSIISQYKKAHPSTKLSDDEILRNAGY